MNRLYVIQLWKLYRPSDIGTAFITSFAFFVLYTGIIVTPMIVVSALFIPYMVYFLLAIYTALSLIISYQLRIFNETLQHLHQEEFNYLGFQKRCSVVLAAIIFVILAIVYVLYLE